MEIFDFSETDVVENRSGRLSQEQEVKLTKKRKRLKFWLLVIGLVILAVGGGMVLIGLNLRDTGDPNWALMLIFAAIFCGLPGLLLVYGWIKPMQSVSIAVVKGPVKVARVQRTSRTNNTTSTYVVTELHIDDKIFWVPDSAFTEFSDGDTYALYYWDGTLLSTGKAHIFSVEKL
jgi:hypothetical protein